MYTLVFCIVIQGIAVITCTLLSQNMKSGIAFQRLLSQRHVPAGADEPPSFRKWVLDAPEGWDHMCFCTEVTERTWGKTCGYSWRISLKQQPSAPVHGPTPVLSGWMPHIVLLVDDSRDMLASCGCSYEEEELYIEKPGGEILPSEQRDDLSTRLSTPAGTCFRGSYGNVWYEALDMYLFGGTMQCWTFVISSLKDFIDELDMCPIAIATVSGGIVQPFTVDRAVLFSTLEGLRPLSPESRISEALLNLVDAFPDGCSTSNHIVLASDGIAIHDGNIPSWIQDYDNDGNPLDTVVDETGSHCLDDVAAYALSQNVHVHVVGPDTPFLRSTAVKGGGVFMPEAGSFDPPESFISLPRCLHGDEKHFLTNVDLAFKPSWIEWEHTSYLQRMANAPPHFASVSSLPARGHAESLFTDGGSLLCSTSRGTLFSIDMAAKACIWMAEGVGGKVVRQNDIIITGPDIQGNVIALDDGPGIRWLCPGELFTTSRGHVYAAHGSTITSHTLMDGIFEAEYTTDSAICAIAYDPCQGAVIAASGTGLVSILGQDLVFQDLLVPDLPGRIVSIRSFRSKRELHVIAVTESHAACVSPARVLWSAPIGAGICTNAVVMDFQLYLSVWEPGECGGIDTGSSTLVILDALTGEPVSRTRLFGAKAFGPLVAPSAGVLEHASWNMAIHEMDISDLPGIRPVSLGERIVQGSGEILP